jgi:hypothetical protein
MLTRIGQDGYMIRSRRAGLVFSTLAFAFSSAAWATDLDPARIPVGLEDLEDPIADLDSAVKDV